MQITKTKGIFGLSLIQSALIIITSCAGLFVPGTYGHETANWQVQSIGQDVIDLFLIVPTLLITSYLVSRKNIMAFLFWGGVHLYLVYTFTIYCFDLHFNSFFVVYCCTLGLSFYSAIYFLPYCSRQTIALSIYKARPVRITAAYFLVIAILFYFLWLSDIVPAIIHHTIPRDLVEAGVVTNPVHVIDLSVFLPGLFITGILILRKIAVGVYMAAALLVFCIMMDITIGGLAIAINIKGMEPGYAVIGIMSALVLTSGALLAYYAKSINAAIRLQTAA